MNPRPASLIGGLLVGPELLERARGPRCVLSECRGACCRNGIWVDEAQTKRILAAAAHIIPLLPRERRDPRHWFDDGEEMVHEDFPSGRGIPTAVVEDPEDADQDACVFLRPGDYFCALHMANEAAGLPYPGLKPVDCATYPVLRSEGELVLDQDSPAELGGADCMRETGERPWAVDVFASELGVVLDEAGLAELMRRAKGDAQGR